MFLAKLVGMSDREVRQVSLQLVLRGDPPFLHAIHFSSPPNTDRADDLQNRALPRAAATALLLFRAHRDLKLFRIRTNQPNGSLVQTILNAKNQPQGKSCIRDLANGAFLKLFLKPSAPESRYLDIDVNRLWPTAVEVTHDGRIVDDPATLRSLAAQIAASGGWDINDYSIEVRQVEQSTANVGSRLEELSATASKVNDSRSSQTVLDNPAVIAIRAAVRQFCEDGTHEHLHVGHIRSSAELEDLWAIDNEAYGEASITYERFKDWWQVLPVWIARAYSFALG